jgi:hypothetical protein
MRTLTASYERRGALLAGSQSWGTMARPSGPVQRRPMAARNLPKQRCACGSAAFCDVRAALR